MTKKILVIGSSNTDMTVKTQALPRPGETLLGGEFKMGPGGKGANQAVAAARLGGDVSFVCKVGNDMFGDSAIMGYEKDGIVTSRILRSAKPSGVALIRAKTAFPLRQVPMPISPKPISILSLTL